MSAARADMTYEMVTVGNPGNASDSTGYGDVAYDYKIGKYEVTISQYCQFLNAVARDDTYYLYDYPARMVTDLNTAGILRSGSPGSYTYSVIGPSGIAPVGASSPGNRPITYVSWFDAARFANWMHNGQPVGPQGPATTETGAYTLNGAFQGPGIARNPGARFYLPSEDEWYKAAFYSATLNSGSGGYYLYATQSNAMPGNLIGAAANQANCIASGFAVTQAGNLSSAQNYLTDVGAFASSASFYGTFDQSGNVFEWFDIVDQSGSSAGLRGGGWTSGASGLSSSNRQTEATIPLWLHNGDVGFRLAAPVAVPEPSTYVMALAGLSCVGFSMRRRRKRA